MQPIRLMLLIINPQKRNLINNPTFGLVSIQDVDLVITAIDKVAPNRKHSSRERFGCQLFCIDLYGPDDVTWKIWQYLARVYGFRWLLLNACETNFQNTQDKWIVHVVHRPHLFSNIYKKNIKSQVHLTSMAWMHRTSTTEHFCEWNICAPIQYKAPSHLCYKNETAYYWRLLLGREHCPLNRPRDIWAI